MSFEQKACVVIVCDGDCGQPWEDGIPHFDSEAEAIDYARAREWLITDQQALCGRCADKATCERTGHQYDDWRDTEHHGIRFQRRWCETCGNADYNPPYKELAPKFQALRDAERIVADAGRSAVTDLVPTRRPTDHLARPWALRAAATGGGPCPTCGKPFYTHVCLSCSPDSQTPGPGCHNCRRTGMDQTPCLPARAKEARRD